jgi:hypothetical protein
MNEEYPQRLAILSELTNTDPEEWEPSDGPESGMGVDSYYVNPNTNQEVWINEDQDYITIACDGETLYEGYISNLEEDMGDDSSY